jgi:hypothetical protein
VARQDVVFNPGSVDFGLVQRGQTPSQFLDVEYSGPLDWRLVEIVKNAGAPFQLSVEELYRQSPGRLRQPGKVGYRLNVTLKADAAPGHFKQELILKTSDPASPVLTAFVEGNVQAALSVAPDHVNLGNRKVGDSEARKVVVRGNRPFHITSIDGQGDGLVAEYPGRDAATQIVTIRFDPIKLGDVKKDLVIRTSLGETATVNVSAKVVAD